MGIEKFAHQIGFENFQFDWLVTPGMSIYTIVTVQTINRRESQEFGIDNNLLRSGFLMFSSGKTVTGDKVTVKFKSIDFKNNEQENFLGHMSIDDTRELIKSLQLMIGDE